MIKCGLTGGIGSGKSMASEIFLRLGIPVFNADRAAKDLYQNEEVQQLVLHRFGSQVFGNSGQVLFKKLASVVFSDSSALADLNSIIHPRVNQLYSNWLTDKDAASATIMESAIIFEVGIEKQFDLLIDVFAPRELCIDRICKRDGISSAQAEQRMASQMDPEIKRQKSGIVLINDEKSLLIPQILLAIRKLTVNFA